MAESLTGIMGDYSRVLAGSARSYDRACAVFPNGVTHDNRFYGPHPIYATRAEKGRKWDVDGREYVDFWMGHGALLLGHCHPSLVKAVSEQVVRGTHMGACHELEIAWGEWVQRLVPSAERVRFTGSGTEATLMALRLARTFTGKEKVLKFDGHFHGWHDNLIVGYNLDAPVPPGILDAVADSVCVCPPNEIERVEDFLRANEDIGCVIIEPTGASFGAIPTRPGFLKALREITQKHDVLLIFDEVVTGFRCAPGGAQAFYGVTPDLTTMAKILAGGLPGGAVAGRKEIMDLLAFRGDREWDTCRKIPHKGTFNANPLSAAAGIATLETIASGEEIEKANQNAAWLRNRLNEVICAHGVNWVVYGDFSGFKILPNYAGPDHAVETIQGGRYDYRKLKQLDPVLKDVFPAAMRLEGIDLSGWSGLVASTHTREDLEKAAGSLDRVLHRLKQDGLIQRAG